MDEDYGSDYITIEDEEGHEFELEHVMSSELGGTDYALFLPADMEETDPDYGYIILKISEENGEELYSSVDDEDELVSIYNHFMEKLFADEESDEETEE